MFGRGGGFGVGNVVAKSNENGFFIMILNILMIELMDIPISSGE